MMNKKTDLTIIVPCYNAESYLDNFEKLLAMQTLKNFKVIFIDDCSSDNTNKRLQKLVSMNKNYSLITNKINKGAGYSRNRAIEQATTNYIGFLDADDSFPENYLEKLYQKITEENADMVLCDVNVTYADGFEDIADFYNIVCHKKKVSKEDIIHNDIAAAAWNKMIKKEILLNNLFAEGIINEDIPAIIGSIIDAKKIVYTNEVYYTYIQRKSSVQNGTKLDKKFDVFKAMDVLEERKKGNKELEKNISAIVYHQIILFLFYGIFTQTKVKGLDKYIKKFEQKAEKYHYRQNPYYWEFLSRTSKKINMYYRIVIKCMRMNLFRMASLVLKLGQFYSNLSKKTKKKILKYDITDKDLIKAARKNQKAKNPVSISVVIPNYNYARFLYQRIYSILYQSIKINEIIILDDCSKDESTKVIDHIVDVISPYMQVSTKYNTKNSGSPFKQWEKGFNMAKADYVWIAEADDYSHEDFLKELVKPIMMDEKIVISYCDTSYIYVNGIKLSNTVTDLIDIMKTGHWDNSYINDGEDEIKNYEFLNCTIANVSSVLFKKDNYAKELKEAGTYQQCGDWYFYYSVMKKGEVAYSTSVYNYCRLHGSNSTTNLKKLIHYNEIKKVQSEIQKEYKVRKDAKKHIKERLSFLRKVWDLPEE